MSYLVHNGKIQGETCEISVVDHCNLSCRGCSHLSPVLPKVHVDPDSLFRDLSALAQHYHADHVRLLGGEPLLHPHLIDVVRAIRSTAISETVRLVTNGLLLGKMAPELWEELNEIHISLYPGKSPSDDELQEFIRIAKLQKVDLRVLHFDKFRETYSESRSTDSHLTSRIYKTCQIAHQWRCHNVYDGYFYKCPQAVFLPRVLGKQQKPPVDGLKIDTDPGFGQRLLEYLESPSPLESCRNCLGSVGQLFAHTQVRRGAWLESAKTSYPPLVDFVFLDFLERVDPEADNLCQPEHLVNPVNADLLARYSTVNEPK